MPRRLVALAPLLLLLLAGPAPALDEQALAERVAEDLTPLEGLVIQGSGGADGEVLVDLGAEQGARAGDLLAVLGPEQVIRHPTTGKEVARVPSRGATLGITRVEESLSRARLLAGEAVQAGDRVRRFAALPARMVDRAGSGEALYRALREALPQLDWQGYAAGPQAPGADPQPPALLFILDDGRLELRYGDGWPVAGYALAAGPAGPAGAGGSAAEAPPAPAAAPAAMAETLAPLPLTVITGDFAASGGELLLAAGSDVALGVFSVTDRGARQLLAADVPHRNRLLALQWWQPEAEGPPLLALTTWDGERVEGMVLRLARGRLEAIQLGLPAILGSFDLDGDGRREALLSQAFDARDFYGAPVRRLHLEGDALRPMEIGVALPRGFPVLGSAIADLNGDGRPEYASIRGQRLRIQSADGSILHTSDPEYSSGLSVLTYDVDPDRRFSPVQRVFFDPAPVVVRRPEGGPARLVAVGARHPALAAPGIDSAARSSRLVSVGFKANRVVRRPVGPGVDQAVPAVTLHGGRAWLVGSGAQGLFGNEASGARLLVLPLP